MSILEGVGKIRTPHAIANTLVNYMVLGLSFLLEGANWLVTLRAFRAGNRSAGLLEAVQRS